MTTANQFAALIEVSNPDQYAQLLAELLRNSCSYECEDNIIVRFTFDDGSSFNVNDGEAV